ncbi:hypothetical protein EYF80_026956 [Liparis tanakae]|uniref:Uncharacterized protein n=1 Tax=Liparis tanakae TaxID=230148 RepID=A0A4Z2HB80_9TELE|nr:hypothetical protein EYF80_026956 [Liparis tanakae]
MCCGTMTEDSNSQTQFTDNSIMTCPMQQHPSVKVKKDGVTADSSLPVRWRKKKQNTVLENLVTLRRPIRRPAGSVGAALRPVNFIRQDSLSLHGNGNSHTNERRRRLAAPRRSSIVAL